MTHYRHFLIGAASRAALADTGLLILRLFTGLALALAHGMGKLPPSDGFVERVAGMGFPAPAFFAWASGVVEFAGGLLLALGLLTRPATLFILINMTVVVFAAHAGQPFGGREKPLLFAVVVLTFLIVGAGRYSLDALVRRRLDREQDPL